MLSTLRQRSAAHATPTFVARGEAGNQRAPGAMGARCGPKENAPEGIMTIAQCLPAYWWPGGALAGAHWTCTNGGTKVSLQRCARAQDPDCSPLACPIFKCGRRAFWCWTWLAKRTPQVASEPFALQKLTAIKENEGSARVLCNRIVHTGGNTTRDGGLRVRRRVAGTGEQRPSDPAEESDIK